MQSPLTIAACLCLCLGLLQCLPLCSSAPGTARRQLTPTPAPPGVDNRTLAQLLLDACPLLNQTVRSGGVFTISLALWPLAEGNHSSTASRLPGNASASAGNRAAQAGQRNASDCAGTNTTRGVSNCSVVGATHSFSIERFNDTRVEPIQSVVLNAMCRPQRFVVKDPAVPGGGYDESVCRDGGVPELDLSAKTFVCQTVPVPAHVLQPGPGCFGGRVRLYQWEPRTRRCRFSLYETPRGTLDAKST